MADDNTGAGNGGAPPTGNSPPADDLRALIAGITTESKKDPPTAPGEASTTPTAPPAQTGEPPAAGEHRAPPERGADGRFRQAGEERPPEPPARPVGEPPGEGGQPPAKPGEPPQPAPGERQPPAPAAREAAAPEHWSAGDKAVFNAWQPQVRDQFLGMYKRMEGGFTQKLQRGAELERGYGEIEQMFQPYGDMLRQRNQAPKDIIKVWHDVEKGLSMADQKDAIIARMIHNYKADPAQIARHLNQLRGFAPQPAAADGGQPQPHPDGYDQYLRGGAPARPAGNGVDPATGIHPVLAARLDALEADRTQRVQADQDAKLQDANRQIQEFANAKDADGNLAHPHYAELEGEMMQLAFADRSAGKTPVIANLYERAAWANPVVRDKILASQREAEDRQQAAARKAKAEAAARAGSSVTGAPSSGQVPNSAAPDRSIRDEIRAQMTGNGTGRV